MESYSSYPNDERTRILRLVEEGKLSATEAIPLLENLSAGRRPEPPPEPPYAEPVYDDRSFTDADPEAEYAGSQPGVSGNGAPRWFRIRVTDLSSGRRKVSVNIPFRLATWGMRVGAHFSPKAGDINLQELSQLLEDDELHGRIVDVVDEEDGEHVEIFVE